ncbi:hypothetical protein [Mycoplasma wenyonii]|nr:hypothetical protein [Mycoplasma wenyonii]
MKLALGGLGFIGIVGASYPALSSHLKSINPLEKLIWGGRFFGSKFTNDLNKEKQKQQLDSGARWDTPKISFSNKSFNLPEATLDLKKKEGSELDSQNDWMKQGDVTTSIESVLSEISKEGKLSDVQSLLSPQYEQSATKYLTDVQRERKKHLVNFQKIQSAVTKWEQSKKTGGTNISVPVLSQAERDSLQKIYELHHDLTIKKDSLNLRLKEISKDTARGSEGVTTQDKYPFEQVKDALRLIGWSTSKVKVQKHRSNTNFYRADNWGTWEQNPYRCFYEKEEEFKSDIATLNKNSSKVHNLKQSIDRQRGLWGWGRATESLDRQSLEVKKLSASTQSHIELQVASALLNLMKTKK